VYRLDGKVYGLNQRVDRLGVILRALIVGVSRIPVVIVAWVVAVGNIEFTPGR
jgi:hypothetical protein